MTSSIFAVRFGDGTMKYGVINESVNFYNPPLFSTPDEASVWWQAYYRAPGGINGDLYPDEPEPGSGEPVWVCDKSGNTHEATATRECLTSRMTWDEICDWRYGTYQGAPEKITEFRPEWAREVGEYMASIERPRTEDQS